ncbi:methyltransferase domain-containing protein [Rhodococcus sp. BP-252]|nr:methyltransferase domain-containing protein [Rhodococcus sp. BP-320]MBY6418534.1 methyltransferase domain-containing protein [Rhodococcus sp. BP-321]MBY6422764.1 methyltransferase domain-containing protein [Rhodococcus sp. BP-324]MBY6428500.1 methyltransferase domain-containing protein [Rhodococcus sp. BP-323]MBY6432949.1 methyltransferase domain-containing protein [Rhodococcus sp. BP-322]MBY6441691.1 methyltransferase domain-containing protein [Rhodococcus sp. BP-319]MBY6446675.1 methyltr
MDVALGSSRPSRRAVGSSSRRRSRAARSCREKSCGAGVSDADRTALGAPRRSSGAATARTRPTSATVRGDLPVSVPPAYFDGVYAEGEDPFGLGSSWYEDRKYTITMASLPRQRYRRALEPGCSVGVLTERLAARCDVLVSTDVVDPPIRTARARVASPHVQFVTWSLADSWESVGTGFDLIVLSEVGYYLDETDLRRALDECVRHLEPGGTLVAVHWRHPVADYPLTGDQVHDAVADTVGLSRLGGYVDEDFVLEVFTAWQPTETQPSETRPSSIARAEGLV